MRTIEEYKKTMMSTLDNNVFIYTSDNKYTYMEFWSKAYVISNKIREGSYKDIVAVMNNGFNLFVLYFSAMLANRTLIPIDPLKAENEINHILSENPSAEIIRDNSLLFDDKERQVTQSEIKERVNEIDFKRVYLITYTSGSTGHPKGVKHSLQNLFAAADSFGSAVGLGEGFTMCHVMPMTYMAGILNTIILPFLYKCKIAIMPRFDVMSALSFWKDVERSGVNAFWLSPTMLNILLMIDKKGKAREYLSKRETLFFIGTAPLYENTRTAFESRYGVRLLQSYGLSETLFISTETNNNSKALSSVGRILPEADVQFGEDSEIRINVPWMFLGYSNEETNAYFDKQYYLSGDLGVEDNGNLYITGRKKDLIIKGGMNISPKQIEDVIIRNDYILECAVCGVEINNEERIVCWYISSEKDPSIENTINRQVEKEIGKNSKIDLFLKVEEIPKNINGKIDKKRLKEEYINDTKI